jgi:hypothetical protein
MSVSRFSRGGAIARYQFVSLEGQPGEFGGATSGACGESLALPPAVHQLLDGSRLARLKAERLFFFYYNRGRVDQTDRFWYDLAILRPFRCFPVYRNALPPSQRVRVLASCPMTLPLITEEAASAQRSQLRAVRNALLRVLTADEDTAAMKLSEAAAVVEDLTGPRERAGLPVVIYVLAFEHEGTTKAHAAIVLK